MSNSDHDLRAAAFAALQRITAPTGGVITRNETTEGFRFEGDRIPFAVEQKGIWRPKQIGRDGGALSVTTAAQRRGVKPKYDDQT